MIQSAAGCKNLCKYFYRSFLRTSIIGGGDQIESLRGRKERKRWTSHHAPAEAGGEPLFTAIG